MKEQLYYFGTDTRSAGHYTWTVGELSLRSRDIDFGKIGFNPESMPRVNGKYDAWSIKDGTIGFYKEGGCSILAIAGSPVDKRPGCKSVFWIEGDISESELTERIKASTVAMSIINAMPFPCALKDHN